MVSYSVEWKKSAVRELRVIDKQHIRRVVTAVESLTIKPFPPNSRKLAGVEASFRLRIGDYRVVYQADLAKKLITIFHVRHRKEAYR